MDDIDALLDTLRTLYTNLEKLRLMEGPEMLLPGRTQTYQQTLEAANTAYGEIEAIIAGLGQELKQQKERLDEGVRKYGE